MSHAMISQAPAPLATTPDLPASQDCGHNYDGDRHSPAPRRGRHKNPGEDIGQESRQLQQHLDAERMLPLNPLVEQCDDREFNVQAK
jgi:hypothetical protein